VTCASAADPPQPGRDGEPRCEQTDLALLLACLRTYGLAFLHRPDIGKAHIRWIIGGPELFGYGPGELEPSSSAFHSLIHPRDAILVVRPRDEEALCASTAGPLTCEYRVRHKSGAYIRVRSILSKIEPQEEHTAPGSMEMLRIIDERLSYDEAGTKLSEDALCTVLNEIGHPVILMDKAGLIVQANEAGERICGHLEHAERFCPFLHTADGRRLSSDILEAVIQRGERATAEVHRFGRWWQVHLVPIRDATRTVARLLLLAQDITSIKTAQDERLQHERALTHTLIREVHHRIKNHLQGLVGLIRLHENARSPDSDIIHPAITQIQSIAAMHGLLAASGRESVVFRSLVSELVSAHRASLPLPIHFTSTAPGDLALELSESEAVPVAITISELITNAAKHTARTAAAELHVTLTSDSTEGTLLISNSPARLPEDFRIDQCLTRRSGLALVMTLLSQSRFRLSFEQHECTVSARLAFPL
jgi:PAS domain S-box-containing protein